MPLFLYKARDLNNNIIEDSIQAVSKAEAISLIKSKKHEILTIKPYKTKSQIFGGKISVSEKAALCRFLATMIRSGMSVSEAFEIVRQENKNQTLVKILSDVTFETQRGKSISAVLEHYPQHFDKIFLTMIRVGENSGTLEKSFDYLSKQLSESHELTQKIKGSMMYPAVIVAAMIANGLLMMLFVLPRISTVFLRLDVPLPFYTKIVLNSGKFFGDNSILVIGFVIAFFVVLGILFKISKTRNMIYAFLSKLPVIKNMSKQIDIARFSKTFSTLLKNGVPIVEAMDVSSDVISDKKMRQVAKSFGERIAKGESLTSVFNGARNIFPSIVIQSIRAGEQSGNLEGVLEEMSVFYEKEIDFALKRFTSLLEPVLMLFIGVVVGFMVLIMIAPIYSIIGSLQSTIQQ